jgi:hypothetical protein
MEDVPTTLWTLHRDGREAACRARLAPYGIEIDLTSGGDPVVTRVFATGEEALAWADKKRTDREAQGWRSADVPRPAEPGPPERET